MKFEPHAQFSIERCENILLTKLTGAWNIEGAEAYCEHIKSAAEVFNGQPWVRIADMSEFDGAPSSITQTAVQLQNWADQNHCIGVIYVAPSSLTRHLIDNNPELANMLHIVESIQQAKQEAQVLLARYQQSKA